MTHTSATALTSEDSIALFTSIILAYALSLGMCTNMVGGNTLPSGRFDTKLPSTPGGNPVS